MRLRGDLLFVLIILLILFLELEVVELTAAHGGLVVLQNLLYVFGIEKNFHSAPTIVATGLHVHLVDDRCTVHDFSNGDVVVMSGILCSVLYCRDIHKMHVSSNAMVVHTSTMADMK